MDWEYAELSHMAKKVGGPEALIRILIQSGKYQMIPGYLVAGGVGFGLGVGATKLYELIKEKKLNWKRDVEQARQEIIDGINEYDTCSQL